MKGVAVASFLRSLLGRTPVPFAPTRSVTLPWGQHSNSTAQMRAMGAVGTLFAIVNRTSNATAQQQWKLYRKAPSGLEEDRVEVTRHAALDLWNKPNPFMPQQEFVESFQQHHDLTGEAWWVIARNPRSTIPLELWPVRPDRMAPVPSATNYLAGYIYTSPDGEKVPLALDEVIFLRTPNPLDPYRGMGPVQSVLTDLDATKYSAEWNRNFFLNSAEPGGIIRVDKRLSDPEFDEMRYRWNEQHRGVANAHRVAILEQGEWVDRKYSQRDMQFAELRNQSRELIREAFGFPKPLLGSVDDVNRANAEAGEVVFARWLIVPRLERIKQALNHDLLPLFGPAAADLEFDYSSPVPEDEEAENAELTAKSNAAAALAAAGWEPDDVLHTVGLPPMRWRGTPDSAPPPPTAHLTRRLAAALPRQTPRTSGTRLKLGDQADTDLEDVRADFIAALDSLTATWDGIESGWIDDLERQIETAVDSGDTVALAALAVSWDDAAVALQRSLALMAGQAAARMVREAADQGVRIELPTVDSPFAKHNGGGPLRAAFGSELADLAPAIASLLASGLAGAAGREALRLARPGATGRSVASAVGDALRAVKGWFRRDQLGGALHRAQNTGRLAVVRAGPADVVITATEVHDGNQCGPCGEIDGTAFPSIEDAEAAYGTGGYINCDGGIRCRGTVVASWPSA